MKKFSDRQMQRYFSRDTRTISNGAIATILGVICVIVGLYLHYLVITLLGGAVFIMTLLVLMFTTTVLSKPTDKEYDQWLEDQAAALAAVVPDKLHLHPSQIIGDVLHLHGFVLPGSADARKYTDVREKKGKDGYWRFSINVYTFFVATEHHIAVFVSDIDALHQSAHLEEAHYYFYNQVAGITTLDHQDKVTIDGKEYAVLLQRFALRIADGSSVGVGATLSAKLLGKKKNAPTITTIDSDIGRVTATLLLLLQSRGQGRGRI